MRFLKSLLAAGFTMLGASSGAMAQSDYEKLDRPADALVLNGFWSQSGLALIFGEKTPDPRSSVQVYFCPRKKAEEPTDCYQQYITLQRAKRRGDGKIIDLSVIVRRVPFDGSWQMFGPDGGDFIQSCTSHDYERLTPLSVDEIEQKNKNLDKTAFYRLPDVRWDHGEETVFKIPRLDGSVDYAVISEPGTRNLDKKGGGLRALFGRAGNIREISAQKFSLYKPLDEVTDQAFITRRHDFYHLVGVGIVSVKEVHEFEEAPSIGKLREFSARFNGRKLPEVSYEETADIRDMFETKKYFDHVSLVGPICR